MFPGALYLVVAGYPHDERSLCKLLCLHSSQLQRRIWAEASDQLIADRVCRVDSTVSQTTNAPVSRMPRLCIRAGSPGKRWAISPRDCATLVIHSICILKSKCYTFVVTNDNASNRCLDIGWRVPSSRRIKRDNLSSRSRITLQFDVYLASKSSWRMQRCF